jgi:hypothetical protein
MRLEGMKLLIACIVAGAVIAVLTAVVDTGAGGAYLLTLVFWTSITQGCVALVAAAELSNAKWILPLRRMLLGVHPLLLFFSLLFLLVWSHMEMYPWAPATSVWLGKTFFILRNFILLILTYVLARLFSRQCLEGGNRIHFYAVLYLLAFVVSQSLVAFDWMMSLEYPWFSTLFGGYFFIEAFYGGIAVAIVISGFFVKRSRENEETLRDSAKMLFGFSLFWAGLFYAQYLVIWYGNLPEELSYLLKRISPPYYFLSRSILALLFIIPFVVLLSKKVKTSRPIMLLIALCVLAGIFLERVLFIVPVVPVSIPVCAVQFIILKLLFLSAMHRDHTRP